MIPLSSGPPRCRGGPAFSRCCPRPSPLVPMVPVMPPPAIPVDISPRPMPVAIAMPIVRTVVATVVVEVPAVAPFDITGRYAHSFDVDRCRRCSRAGKGYATKSATPASAETSFMISPPYIRWRRRSVGRFGTLRRFNIGRIAAQPWLQGSGKDEALSCSMPTSTS